jgi:hypothetical protein
LRILLKLTLCSIFFNTVISPVRSWAVYDDSGDMALGAPVTVDSVYENNPAYAAIKATDSNDNTRWASAPNTGVHWMQVDLGEVKSVNQVQVNWDAAYGKNYAIQASKDGTNWQPVVTIVVNTNAGLVIHSFNTISARYIQLNCAISAQGTNISIYEFRVYCGNLALNKAVSVDSVYSIGYEAYKAIDGNLGTRWASAANAGTHWISVDLGEIKLVRQVQIDWERGSGADYTIQLSTNGTTWTTKAAIIGNNISGWINHPFDAAPARYVKINCTRATLGANISIYELYVGVDDSSSVVDFSTKTATFSPYFIGGNQYVSHDLAPLMNPQFTNMGFNRMRGTVNFQNIIPTNLCASLADYTNNVNNIQNPANWDFSDLYWMDDATNYGFKILLVFAYTPTWLSFNTNWTGVPKDWAVWQDICSKVYKKYKNEIGWAEPWNETEYFLDLTGSPYMNSESFQADLYYYTAQGVRLGGGTNVPIGGFALSGNDFLTARTTLRLMISKYGLPWVNSNYNYYSCHQYWGDAAELDVLSVFNVLQSLGLNTNIPIFLDEWNYPYWWPDTGEYTDQQAIGFVGKSLAKMLKRGISADYYALNQLYDPETNPPALYPQAVAFQIAATTLGLNHGSNTICQTTDYYIDSVAGVNPNGNPVIYIANYSDITKRVYVNLNGITNSTISGSIYMGTISNGGNNVYETFSMAKTNASAVLDLDMVSNSVCGLMLNGGCNATNILTNSVVSNIALASSQSVSSTYPGYDAYMAIDGLEKITDRGEWASDGELNPWIQLSWPASMNIYKVVLLDRPNLTDAVNKGVLYFSDGNNIPVSFVANDGSPAVVIFPTKQVTWVKFQVTGGSGLNVGLSEFKVFGSLAVTNIAFPLAFSYSPAGLTLTWPTTGTLQQASNIHGPWVTATEVTNGLPVPMTAAQQFYRILY